MQDFRSDELRIWAQSSPLRRAIELTIGGRTPQGKYYAATSAIEFREVEDGVIIPPTLDISPEAAQLLMDELWNCGIRPSEGTGSAGALKATQNHLEDMRQLAYHLMKMPAPAKQ